MRRVIGIVILCVLFGLLSSLSAQTILNEPTVEVEKLNDHLSKITCSANFSVVMLASVGKDGILLVDTGLEECAEKLKSKLEKLSTAKIVYIINSHEHSDHTGCNKQLGKGVTIIAHEKVKQELQSGYNLFRELPDYALPNKPISSDMSLTFNGDTIRIMLLPGSHSDTDLIVYFVESKIVYTGGIVTINQFPFADTNKGGSFKAYPAVLKKMIDTLPDDTTFIPGHGPTFTKAELIKFHTMVEESFTIIEKAISAGKDVQTMQKEKILAKWDSYGQGFIKTDNWIKAVVEEQTKDKEKQKEPLITPIFTSYKEKGLADCIDTYRKLKKTKSEMYDFNENVLNAFGYYLLGKQKIDDAITVFKLNIKEYPEAYNVYDSLGEAFMINGEREMAIKYYKKALEINPDFENSKIMLKRLDEQRKKE